MAGRLLGNRPLLLGVALALGVVGALSAFRIGLTPPDTPPDFDVEALEAGLEEYCDLKDTFRWFTGNWIVQNPFWRPLSSYAFWTLHKILGWEHYDRWEIVRAISHVIVTGLLFWFMVVVTGRPLLALLAVFMQNVPLILPVVDYLYIAPGVGAVGRWIELPDIWLAMVTLPALWLAWEGEMWWSVPLVAAAAMIKETGFFVFPLAMFFYWWRHRRLHPAFIALIAIGAVFSAVKLIYVGPGWVLGSNRSIWVRIARFVLPIPINNMLTGTLPWTVIGIGLGVAIIVAFGPGGRPRLAPGILAASFVLSILGYRYTIGGPGGVPELDIALAGVLDPRLPAIGAYTALWIVAAWAGLRGPDRGTVVLLVVAHLATGFPGTLAPQAGTRSFYTAMLFSSCVSAVCAWSLPVIVGRPVRQEPLLRAHAEHDGEPSGGARETDRTGGEEV